MRITQSIITNSLLSSLNRNRESMHAVQKAITSGKQVDRASTDPVKYARANRFRKQINQNEQYLKNIQDGKIWLETTSETLNNVYEKVLQFKEKAVQASDESLSLGQRETISNEVSDMIEDLMSIVNETYLGKNLFAGTKTKTDESFTFDGGTVTYNGNTGSMNRRVSEHLSVKINVSGQDLLDTNVFSATQGLKTALTNNNTSEINSAIESLESTINNVVMLNSTVGSIQNQIIMAEDRLETANTNLSSYLSDTEDVNMAEAITKYNEEEITYRAALQATANVMKINIMDFLR